MKKRPLVLLMSYMALTLGGCGLFNQSDEPTEEPPVAESPETIQEPETTDEVFEEETPSTPQVPATDGLIPSTEPSARRQQIRQGRDNPFAIIPVKIRAKTDDENGGTAQNVAAGTQNGATTAETLCQIEEVSTPATTVAQGPGTAVPASSTVLEPVLPIPNEARGVFVSGVVQLSGEPVAIVEAPNENVARHVSAGASLSNGQVKVKSINVNSSKPYVVLEQYGLDISRAVGEPPEEPVEPPTPAAAPAEPPIAPPEPSGYGTVNDVVLQQVDIKDENSSNPLVSGTLCNSGSETIKVSNLTLQVEEQGTGKIINSMRVELAATYTIPPGGQAEFDDRIGTDEKGQKSELGIRDREKGEITIRLVDWS